MKTCRTCREVFPFSAFYKHNRMADGHLNICKECTKSRIRAYSCGNPVVIAREKERSKQPHRIEQGNRYRRSAIGKQARTAVHTAIKRGELAPASACECNDCRKPAAVLHHHSYEPEHLLGVVPLCRSCHGIRHAYPERFN